MTLNFPEDGKYARGKRLIYLSISQIQHVPKYHTARRQALLSTLPVSWVFCTNFDCTEKHFLKKHMLKEWDVLREQVSLHQTRMWKTQEGSSQWAGNGALERIYMITGSWVVNSSKICFDCGIISDFTTQSFHLQPEVGSKKSLGWGW